MLNANGIQTCKDYVNENNFLLEYFSKVSDEDKQELMLIKNLIKEKLETEEKYFKIKKLDFGYNNNNKNTNSTFIVNKISGNYNLSLFI